MIEQFTSSFSTEGYWELFWLVRNSIITAAVLGLMGGVIGIFIMLRRSSLAVHGIAEISFAGPRWRCWPGLMSPPARPLGRWPPLCSSDS